MLGIDAPELFVIALVALVVIGPKDLPRVMRVIGRWIGRARGMTRHFRAGFDEMIRQSEMEEMEKRWAAENARIMAAHPSPPPEEADDAHHAGLSAEHKADTADDAHDAALAASTQNASPSTPAAAADELSAAPGYVPPPPGERPEAR